MSRFEHGLSELTPPRELQHCFAAQNSRVLLCTTASPRHHPTGREMRMEPEASINNMATVAPDAEATTREPAFEAQWQNMDTAHLQPSNLPIAKVQRAWERKPLSPRNRQHLRVGKVWKRPVQSAARFAKDTGAGEDGRSTKRVKRRSSSGVGDMKAVKKLCTDSSFGMGARVAKWESRDSPERKIVTRSASTEDSLDALSDGDEQSGVEMDDRETNEEAGVTIDILGEDGTVLETNADAEEVEADEDWEEVEEDDLVPEDANTMHINDAARDELCLEDPKETDSIQLRTLRSTNSPSKMNEEESNTGDRGKDIDRSMPILNPVTHVTLPEGFVSPARPRRLGLRAATLSGAGRRRTLPVQFAPAVSAIELADSVTTPEILAAPEHAAERDEPAEAEASNPDGADVAIDDADYEWDDVNDEELATRTDGELVQDDPELALSHGDQFAAHGKEVQTAKGAKPITRNATVERLPSSPVPTIEGPHPRLPLRRSPRRKSSSPLKQSVAFASNETSHLVAFTPVKRPASYPPAHLHPGHTLAPSMEVMSQTSGDEMPEVGGSTPQQASPVRRASSAPPEEPQMSPHKPARPRVSDDTALLQAFLSRAAESKSSRSISTTRRESITNRRDSDAVRQALASPGATGRSDVLVDLDPNSPSPRKTPTYPTADITAENIISNTSTQQLVDDEQIEEDQPESVPTTRRSGRGRKKPQVLPSSVFSQPARITIKGQANSLDVKKTEAQELALATRNNTRKNKGTAVLPKLRLTQFAISGVSQQATSNVGAEVDAGEIVVQQETNESGESDMLNPRMGVSDNAGEQVPPRSISDGGANDGRRSVRWAEVLASFHERASEPELSQLSDDSQQAEERLPWERSAKGELDSDSFVTTEAPPPPSDTPSKPKPKLRRLKASRTAAAATASSKVGPTPSSSISGNADAERPNGLAPAAVKDEAQQVGPTTAIVEEAKAKPAGKVRRSRIATPAKGLTSSSLLPADVLALQPNVAAAKNKLASKLPAPSISVNVATTAGKENVLASPAKKSRSFAATALPTSKTFAPKLEFGKTTLYPTPITDSGDAGVASLASPAKKGGKRANIFAPKTSMTASGNDGEAERGREDAPGLSSPAKKRTRRTVF